MGFLRKFYDNLHDFFLIIKLNLKVIFLTLLIEEILIYSSFILMDIF